MGSKKKKPDSLLNNIRKFGLNKYLITALAFFIWTLFFDKHNIFTQMKILESVEKLEKETKNYQELLIEAKAEKQKLESNKEKYARERYLMHKENEKVFYIDRQKESK